MSGRSPASGHATIRLVTRVKTGITWSRLPIAVSIVVAATRGRIVAVAKRDADPDAKVRTSPEATTVEIASACVETAGIISSPSNDDRAAIIAASRGYITAAIISATSVRRGHVTAP